MRLVLAILCLLIILPTPASDAAPAEASIIYRVVEAFYEGQQVYYYTFKNGTPVLDDGAAVETGLQYRLVDEAGEPVEGQHDLITVGAFASGYSDLREIVEVTVPPDYEANSITSVQELLVEDWPQQPTGELYNIPVVFDNAVLQGRDHDPINLWLNGETVTAFNFGQNPAETAPIYVLVEGFDDDGSPIRIGHPSVIEIMHDDEGYSDFWQLVFVTVPADTEPNSIRSIDELLAVATELTPSERVINCPAIGLDEMAVAYLDNVAYNITYIPQPDFVIEDALSPIYAYLADDGIPEPDAPLLLSVGEGGAAFAAYCAVVYLTGFEDYATSAAEIDNNPGIVMRASGEVRTCAPLSEVRE